MKGTGRSLIAILSDFGTVDNYVGVMKGIMLGIAPAVAIADLTHEIPPQNLPAAQFALQTAVDYFPPGTIFLAVVDPGVGTRRRAITLQTENHYFVGPDNGLFSPILQRTPAIATVQLTNPNYWRAPHPSTTFHGRDIFAPVAAHLAAGVPLEKLGEAITPNILIQLPPPTPKPTPNGWVGHIQYIDRFGNLITNLPGDWVINSNWVIQIGTKKIPGGQTYGAAEPGQLIALVGSHGWVEIAQNQGSAAIALGLSYGDRIHLSLSR